MSDPEQIKVLIVEDNDDSRDMLVRRLKRRGYQIVEAVDGQQAVDQASREHPDIILMDIDIPVFNGHEATRRIHALPACSQIPVIGLSANAMEGDDVKALEAGCVDYETKPIDLDRLIQKLHKWV